MTYCREALGTPSCPHSLTIHRARLTPVTIEGANLRVVRTGTLLLPQGPQVSRYPAPWTTGKEGDPPHRLYIVTLLI